MKTNEKEIKALINLIDDPDEFVYQQIRSRLIELGEPVIPSLENVWEFNSLGALFQDRIEDIVHQIQIDQLKTDLTNWFNNGANNLMEGMLIINRYQYPEIDTELIKEQIKSISRQIWIEINDNLTAIEKVRVFNNVLFNNLGFHGNKKNYHSPNNSYLSTVLETKKGNPLLLSALYMLVAEQLEEPIYGVNLPSHFLLAYVDKHNIAQLLNNSDSNVLFYINSFSNGSLLHKKEIDSFLEQLDLPKKKEFFEPCSVLDIIIRMLNNLMYSYQQAGLPEKVEELDQLMALISDPND